MRTRRKPRYSFRLTEEFVAVVDRQAEAQSMSRSDYLRIALAEKLRRDGVRIRQYRRRRRPQPRQQQQQPEGAPAP